jgi:hypothetical protein
MIDWVTANQLQSGQHHQVIPVPGSTEQWQGIIDAMTRTAAINQEPKMAGEFCEIKCKRCEEESFCRSCGAGDSIIWLCRGCLIKYKTVTDAFIAEGKRLRIQLGEIK